MESPRVHRQGQIREAVPEKRREAGQVLGQRGQAYRLDQALYARQEHLLRLSRNLDQMVRGRHSQRCRQLHRSPSEEARQAGRHHLGARRPLPRRALHHLSRTSPGSLPSRQRAQGQRGQARRPRHHLPAHDPGSGLRHARLRAHRRHSFRRVRGFLSRLARGPHRRLQIANPDHGRRGSTRRPQGAAQGQCRQGAEQGERRREGSGGQAYRRRGALDSGPRSVARRGTRQGRRGLSARGNERGGSAVYSLYLGLDGTAQGRAAHFGRLSRVRRNDASIRVRLP